MVILKVAQNKKNQIKRSIEELEEKKLIEDVQNKKKINYSDIFCTINSILSRLIGRYHRGKNNESPRDYIRRTVKDMDYCRPHRKLKGKAENSCQPSLRLLKKRRNVFII